MNDLFVLNDWTENVFCATGPGGGIDPTCPKGGNAGASRSGGLSRLPQSREEAEALAWAARDNIIGPDDDSCAETGQCLTAAAALSSLHPEIDVYRGLYKDDPDGEHKIIKAGDYFIDITADQFGGPPVAVFTQDDLYSSKKYEAYRGFYEVVTGTPSVTSRFVYKGIVEELREYEHGGGMVPITENVFCPTGPGGGIDPTCPGKGGAALGGALSTSEQETALSRLSSLPNAEEGYQTFEANLEQIAMKDIFSGMGSIYGVPERSKVQRMSREVVVKPEQIKYSQSSVVRSAIEKKIKGVDDQASKFGSEEELPTAIKDKGFYHIQTGHHRAVVQALARGEVRMSVIEVKERTKSGKAKYGSPTE